MPSKGERLSKIIDQIKKCENPEEFCRILTASENLREYYEHEVISAITRNYRFDLFKVLLENGSDTSLDISGYSGNCYDIILDFLIAGNPDKNKVVINERVDFIKLLLKLSPAYALKKPLKLTLSRSILEKDDEMFNALLEHVKFGLTKDEKIQLVFDTVSSESFTTLKILFEKDFIVENIFSGDHGQDILKFIFKEAPKENGKYTEDSCNFIRALFDKLNQNKEPDYMHPFVYFCIHKESPEVLIKFLIESQIVKIDTITPSRYWTRISSLGNFTISMAAARNNNICLLNILKEKQQRSEKATSIFDQADSDGRTVAHHVRSSEAATIVLTESNINHKDKRGNSPLFYFLVGVRILNYSSGVRTKEARIDAFKLIETLIEHSDLSNNKSGQNILYVLSKIDILGGEKQMFTDLVNKIFARLANIGANIPQLLIQKNKDFKTPLSLAFDYRNFLSFKLILKQEEKYKVTNLVDEYLLEKVILSGSEEIVEHLLSQEVDLKSLIPEETLVYIANDLEENQKLLGLSEQGKKCLKLLNKAVEGFKKPTEMSRNKNSGRIAFSEFFSLFNYIESGFWEKFESILSRAGPASKTTFFLILRELQKNLKIQRRSQNDPSIDAEVKQYLDLSVEAIKKLENLAEVTLPNASVSIDSQVAHDISQNLQDNYKKTEEKPLLDNNNIVVPTKNDLAQASLKPIAEKPKVDISPTPQDSLKPTDKKERPKTGENIQTNSAPVAVAVPVPTPVSVPTTSDAEKKSLVEHFRSLLTRIRNFLNEQFTRIYVFLTGKKFKDQGKKHKSNLHPAPDPTLTVNVGKDSNIEKQNF